MWAAGIHDAGPASAYSCLTAVATHVVVSCGQSTNQTTWVASDVTVVTDTELKLVFQCYLLVFDGKAASCCRQVVGDRRPLCSGLFVAFQAASKERPWDNYRRFALFQTEGMLAYVRRWLCATVAVNSVCACEQRRCVTSIGIQSPLLGLLKYLFPFRNTRLSMYLSSRREWS